MPYPGMQNNTLDWGGGWVSRYHELAFSIMITFFLLNHSLSGISPGQSSVSSISIGVASVASLPEMVMTRGAGSGVGVEAERCAAMRRHSNRRFAVCW